MALAEGVVRIQDEKKGDVLILHFKGRLDAVSSPNAEKKVIDYINSGDTKLILDLQGVDYMSSAGMRMLLATTKKLRTFPGKCVICALTPNVMDLLKMSGFDHVLELTPDVESALKKF